LLKYAVLKPAVDFDRLEEVLVIIRSREPIAVPQAVTPQTTPGQTSVQSAPAKGTSR
jgi:rod shape-determining protein MreC